ncbi:MAG: GreA/GreB family elongation factor [Dehalococcoidia bacterium]
MATKTEILSTEQTDMEQLTVSEAFQVYVRQLPQDAKQKAQPEIAKFVRWVGGDRLIASISPAEVGEYSDSFSAKSTSADATERLGLVKLFLTYLKKKGHVDINLAQHLRLRKSRSSAAQARAISGRQQTVRLTRAGYTDMTKKLVQLQDERVKLADDIRRAAADKDVRENAPLEAARENQGMVVAKIREIEATLKVAIILDGEGQETNRVHIGSKITLTEVNSTRSVGYQLVEPNEANPLAGKISVISPVGAAILGRTAGDEVKVKTPRGEQTYKIDKTD